MTDPDTGDAFTQHTTFEVPVLLSNAGDVTLRDGALSDVAPTMLSLMGIAKPAEMTGQSLILPARSAALPREARAQA
jgi:2,3-bisphosphoglycerate-independent phosphoglycerate mutase